MLDGKEVRLTEEKHDLVMAETSPPRAKTQAEEGGEHSLPKGNLSIALGQEPVLDPWERAAKHGGKKYDPVPLVG